ncbi:MAG TPA: hypothetical protein VNZ52_07920 [Candidatus Thermoplasmatota archaeon]|nr:hypothetical protein [Candidatus Thermoplasmatota archaeon]
MKAGTAQMAERDGARSLAEQLAILNELLGLTLILGVAVGLAFAARSL